MKTKLPISSQRGTSTGFMPKQKPSRIVKLPKLPPQPKNNLVIQ